MALNFLFSCLYLLRVGIPGIFEMRISLSILYVYLAGSYYTLQDRFVKKQGYPQILYFFSLSVVTPYMHVLQKMLCYTALY